MKISFVIIDNKPVVKVLTDETSNQFIMNVFVDIKDNQVVNETEIKTAFERVINAVKACVKQRKPVTQKDIDMAIEP